MVASRTGRQSQFSMSRSIRHTAEVPIRAEVLIRAAARWRLFFWKGAAAGSSAANATGPASGFSDLTGAGIGNLTEGQAGPGQNADAAAIPEYVVAGNWRKNADGTWQFEAGGRSYASEWAAVHNPYADPAKGQSTFDWFRFDADGRMVNGWYTDVDGNTYYLWTEMDGTQGRMLTGWNWLPESDGVFHCYYFQEKSDGMRGRLYRNTHTPMGI